MLSDKELTKAVSRILQRSERQEDPNKLLGTYVDVGILPQLQNNNNRIFFGRRGTGKTHVLKVLGQNFQGISGNAVIYLDARTLGSSSQFMDVDEPLHLRCLSLFRDIVQGIQNELFEYVVEHPTDTQNLAIDALGELGDSVSKQHARLDERVRTESVEALATEQNFGVKATAAHVPDVTLMAGSNDKQSASAKEERSYKIAPVHKIYFPEVHDALGRALKFAKARLYLLLDEWSFLPLDLQPYLAEFVKRGLLPINLVTVKLTALEYRSHFNSSIGERQVGFELGADISTATDLDDYLVYDRNPEHITDVYSDVLYRHISSELSPNYLKDKYGMTKGRDLASKMFTERKTFQELARASEGVIRDLINIFIQAYFAAQKRGRDTIDKKAILEAAQKWFEQDKAQQLDDDLRKVLQRIVEEVIGARKARSFLLPRELENNPVVQKLFDLRVLHLMQRGYADKDRPGVRYNIYSIDYGTFVGLIGTSKEPDVEMGTESSPDTVVPFDDKRTIRRIVLSEEVLTVIPAG